MRRSIDRSQQPLHAQLRDRGVDVDAEVSRMGGPVPPLFWLHDLEGNTLMVVEVR
jgi:hypothetical protein